MISQVVLFIVSTIAVMTTALEFRLERIEQVIYPSHTQLSQIYSGKNTPAHPEEIPSRHQIPKPPNSTLQIYARKSTGSSRQLHCPSGRRRGQNSNSIPEPSAAGATRSQGAYPSKRFLEKRTLHHQSNQFDHRVAFGEEHIRENFVEFQFCKVTISFTTIQANHKFIVSSLKTY